MDDALPLRFRQDAHDARIREAPLHVIVVIATLPHFRRIYFARYMSPLTRAYAPLMFISPCRDAVHESRHYESMFTMAMRAQLMPRAMRARAVRVPVIIISRVTLRR